MLRVTYPVLQQRHEPGDWWRPVSNIQGVFTKLTGDDLPYLTIEDKVGSRHMVGEPSASSSDTQTPLVSIFVFNATAAARRLLLGS